MGVLPLPPPYNPKMHHHLVALALCAPLASATIEIAAGSATGALILSASQAQLLTLIALAGKLGVGLLGGGYLLSRRGRGKRSALQEELLLLVGPDASQVNSELRAPGSKQAERIRQAAIFGMSRRDVAKCEHHFQCSVKTSDIVRMFSEDS